MQVTKEAIWMTKLMKELGYMKEKKAMMIWCDNQGVISLMKNHIQHVRTKHIDVQYHFVREWVQNDEIKFKYYSTKDMVADVLIKALPRKWHNKLITIYSHPYNS
jgi:hypothetical protein